MTHYAASAIDRHLPHIAAGHGGGSLQRCATRYDMFTSILDIIIDDMRDCV
jgi:hypothetical protein